MIIDANIEIRRIDHDVMIEKRPRKKRENEWSRDRFVSVEDLWKIIERQRDEINNLEERLDKIEEEWESPY